jgi:hypothetical protein
MSSTVVMSTGLMSTGLMSTLIAGHVTGVIQEPLVRTPTVKDFGQLIIVDHSRWPVDLRGRVRECG